MQYEAFYSHSAQVYGLPGFEPQRTDAAYLRALGVSVQPSEETLGALEKGSELFGRRYREKLLIPRTRFTTGEIDPSEVTTRNSDKSSITTSFFSLLHRNILLLQL